MGIEIATAAAIAGLAAGAVSAGGSLMAGHAASERADYQAQVARNNAQIADQNAFWAEQSGAAKETAMGMRTRATTGKMRAAMGASGVDVGTGSSADVLDSAAALGELDALTIRSNTAREVYGYKVAKDSMTAEATLHERESDYSQLGSYLGAGGSLLSSASSVGGKYAGWQNVGARA